MSAKNKEFHQALLDLMIKYEELMETQLGDGDYTAVLQAIHELQASLSNIEPAVRALSEAQEQGEEVEVVMESVPVDESDIQESDKKPLPPLGTFPKLYPGTNHGLN